jgi:hypothetical protein
VNGFPERGSGVPLIGFGPEEGEEGVASVEAVRRSGGEIGEEGEALGLGEHPGCVGAGGSPHRRAAKQPELD